jgi:alpha-amylase
VRIPFLLVALSLAACGGGSDGGTGPGPVNPGPVTRPTLPQTYTATGHAAAGDVSVQLFEWAWADVARECELHLGPMGYRAALVSPPQEHIGGGAWWTRYQPVSYSLAQNRSGTRAQFADMVQRCATAGVDIYVDAVINHMTGGNGTGTNGTVYTKYNYPGLYDVGDFHLPCGISDWTSAAQVQDCELIGLSDLNTGTAKVQTAVVAYLADLVDIGVRGFRIDAAKHIQPVQLDSIVTKLNRAVIAGGDPVPYFFLEVIDMGDAGVKATDYYGLGFHGGSGSDLSEFKYRGIRDKFMNSGGQQVADLMTFSEVNWSLMPSNKALVFLENHDTQRSGGVTWDAWQRQRLAYVFMLAEPYGYPMVMSSYAFDQASGASRDAGPPAGNGTAAGQSCSADIPNTPDGQWVCEHRDPLLGAMIRFRAATAGQARQANATLNANFIAFSRGTTGFVAINNGASVTTGTVTTSLAAGTYCDLLTGGKVGGACAGTTVTIDAGGVASLSIPAFTAVVLLTADKL